MTVLHVCILHVPLNACDNFFLPHRYSVTTFSAAYIQCESDEQACLRHVRVRVPSL
jgi:hypothetical protein